MNRRIILSLALLGALTAKSQIVSNATGQTASDKAGNYICFDVTDEGKATPVQWGLDTQWISEENMRRGINFSSQNIIDIIRVGFMPKQSVSDGKLSDSQVESLTTRANLVKKWCKDDVVVNIGDDPAEGNGVDGWYNDNSVSSITRGERWAQCIDLHRQKYEELGLKVVSVSPFNEPDYGWNQGNGDCRHEDFKNTAMALSKNYNGTYGKDGIRICGCNTLNDDNASWWWNYCKDYLNEGNTHQLAGSFDSYANFFKEVRAAGHHASADELHNVMEAIVGIEYGMQTGIWWGTACRTRGQFMKATHGDDGGARLAYAENRNAFTAAAVYRLPDGTINGFVGTSERQCQPDSYQFISLDRDVYYNGQGPRRDFMVSVPGGYGYQDGQTNAETVIDITSGEDVPPYLNGTYKIENLHSGLVLSTNVGSGGWQQITQRKNSTRITNTFWNVTPVDNTIGEDFAYYHIQLNDDDTYHWDIKNWNIEDKAAVGVYPGGGVNAIEQWYFEYAGDNSFYIRSRFSNLVVEIGNSSTAVGAAIHMANFTGEDNQKWRLIPTDVVPEQEAPEAPTNLTATSQNASIRLDWTASTSDDVRDYFVIRAEEGSEEFNTIGRYITGTTFTDNTAEDGKKYVYAVKAEDLALNRSERSELITASVTEDKGLVCHIGFNSDYSDDTENGNFPALYGTEKYTTKCKEGDKSFHFDGTRFMQLPSTVANHDEMTISFWLWRLSTTAIEWERVFDFGNSTNAYMLFSPTDGDGNIRFEMKNGNIDELLTSSEKLNAREWNHLAVTISADKHTATMYLNGEMLVKSEDFTIRPTDISPVMNYIARSQYNADPNLKAYLDDFSIYNYAMTDAEIKDMYEKSTGIESVTIDSSSEKAIYDVQGRRLQTPVKGINIVDGRKVIR